MLLLDTNTTLMPATVAASRARVPTFGPHLTAGSMYSMLALANTSSQLPDIIGEITAVKSSVSDPPEDKNHLMVTVKMDNNVNVTSTLTLFLTTSWKPCMVNQGLSLRQG
ncbi:Uncharacterized protein Rs2_52686 [Raphanus sativus]|nr:Uncharacterized protein Rs2_52686 [Raphanus sativus]